MIVAREQETEKAKAIYADNCHKDLNDFESWQNEFEESYAGKWDSIEDFAVDLVNNSGWFEGMSEFALAYLDYAKLGRDLLMDGYWEKDGHFFRDI